MSLMITTMDNPHDPRVDFKVWDEWDRAHGYNTSSYLERVAALPDELPDVMIDRMRDDAILEIIEMHGGQMYKALSLDEELPQAASVA